MSNPSRERAGRALEGLRGDFQNEAQSQDKLYNAIVYAPHYGHEKSMEFPPVTRFEHIEPRVKSWIFSDNSIIVSYWYGREARVDRFGQLALHASRAWEGLSPVGEGHDRGITGEVEEMDFSYESLLPRFGELQDRLDVPLWLLVVHSLAWHRALGHPLQAFRKTWCQQAESLRTGVSRTWLLPYRPGLEKEEQESFETDPQALLEGEHARDYFFSVLPDDVFQCSALAIDLIREMTSDKPGANIISSPAMGVAERSAPPPPEVVLLYRKTNVGSTENLPIETIKRLKKLKNQIDPDDQYIGYSPGILKVFEQIDTLNKMPDKPVLLRGPSGAGKSKIAELIHLSSKRSKKRFRVEQASDNRAADPIIIKNRWTGYGNDSGLNNVSKEQTSGILQENEGGTVFVDELGALSLEFQVFLLAVLDRSAIPLTAGSGLPVRPDVRLIFATNEDLERAVDEGRFRPELLRRISQGTIWIPSLSARREDIFHFVHARCGKHYPSFGFLLALMRHSWPGNVGELLDVLDNAIALTRRDNEPLTVDHLRLGDPELIPAVERLGDAGAAREVLGELASMLVRQGWTKGRGLQARMAEFLGCSESSVSRFLSKHMPELKRTPDQPDPSDLG